MGWSHAAKTQQADGAGRGPNRLTAVRLTNRVWPSETLISSACSGPVVSVPVPFLLLFALCCLRACCAVDCMLYVLCCMYYVGACCGNAGKQVGKSPADGDVEAANLRVTAYQTARPTSGHL
ncbi:hypothetical protein V8C43DRAFT_298864, partial [Trichoderma afarasin]